MDARNEILNDARIYCRIVSGVWESEHATKHGGKPVPVIDRNEPAGVDYALIEAAGISLEGLTAGELETLAKLVQAAKEYGYVHGYNAGKKAN